MRICWAVFASEHVGLLAAYLGHHLPKTTSCVCKRLLFATTQPITLGDVSIGEGDWRANFLLLGPIFVLVTQIVESALKSKGYVPAAGVTIMRRSPSLSSLARRFVRNDLHSARFTVRSFARCAFLGSAASQYLRSILVPASL